jgi:hypothetical protein
MVKSNAIPMPTKTRRRKVDPKLLEQLDDLDRRAAETDRRIEETLAQARALRRKLRAILESR